MRAKSFNLHFLLSTGNTYNIPMRVMLMEDYPASAPLIYVTPTSNMIFGKNVPYVNSRGKIYTQYLENWEREVLYHEAA